MADQQPPPSKMTDRIVRKARDVESTMNEVHSTVDMLRTQSDRAGLLGKRILVPPDEIHVVVGDGRFPWAVAKETKIFGQTADRPSRYWLNRLTQVIKLKTISFTVALRGDNNEGIEALDNSKVSVKLWAHAVAKLNPDKADVAAQRVGLDTSSLIKTITQVGEAALISTAASMSLEQIITNRQELAEKASQQVNKILSELGYDLALLTITRLDGHAYQKMVEQAESRISKEATIVTNKEQLAEMEDREARERRESQIEAQTQIELANKRLEAEEKVQQATLTQQEVLNEHRHTQRLKEINRQKVADKSGHEADVARIELEQKRAQVELENKARIAEADAANQATLNRQKSEREADLRGYQQQQQAKIRLAEAEDESQRLALEQLRQIERDAERTKAEAERLRAQELAMAERAKEVALVEAQQLAEGMELEASSQAEATRIRAEAETKAVRIRAEAESQTELIRAEAEATATEKRAQAAKIRAEANRAEAAAPGLAKAEVDEARLAVSEKEVAVSRAGGLAEAEIARAKSDVETQRTKKLKDIELETQRQMAELYNTTPVLIELEKHKLNLSHQERIATVQAETYVRALEALAPSMRINIYGNGGQTTQILTDIMTFSQGMQHLGEEVPLVGQLLQRGNGVSSSALSSRLGQFMPYLRQSLAEVNPRMLSSLKISDLVDRLSTVIRGEENLVAALDNIREDASFRVVGDLPVQPLLNLLGINLTNGKAVKGDANLAFDDDDNSHEVFPESPAVVDETEANESGDDRK